LNHLLNFTFAPREGSFTGGSSVGSGWKGRNKWGSGRTTLKYNKEQFLQANCQFIVKESGDYLVHAVDPDILVDWDLVEQVRIGSNTVPSCPICLYPPTAAKITRCGHVYCWSCILHYLSLGEKSWRKCPICYESIHQKDLKSVVASKTTAYLPQQTITMKLMKREKGSTYVIPRNQWTDRKGKLHQIDDDVDVCYTKLLIATTQQVQNMIDEEDTALECQLQDEPDSLEGSFIEAARQLLKERQASLRVRSEVQAELTDTMENLNIEPSMEEKSSELWKPSASAVRYSLAFSDEEAEQEEYSAPRTSTGISNEPVLPVSPEAENDTVSILNRSESISSDLTEGGQVEPNVMPVEEAEENLTLPSDGCGGELVKNEARFGNKSGSSFFYFYQAADGQHIYLHSLNARCMIKEYGSWENCPDFITASIVDLEGISMNSELRRRLRYLNHLPLTCEFKVAELDLKPPLLSDVTLENMADEIEKRQRARQKKIRDERRKMKKMQDSENRKMGFYPDMRVNLQSSRHFPSANVEVDADSSTQSTTSSVVSTPFGSPQSQPGMNPYASEFVPGSPPQTSCQTDGQQTSSTPSFAQMLQQGKTRTVEAWSKTKNEAPATKTEGKKSADSDESDNEDRVPVPVFQTSFGDAIQAALDSYKNTPDVSSQGEAAPSGKKKKAKKKLLFTTSMARMT
jgi:hypothetical protein